MSANQYEPAEVSHSELLKYHLNLSAKVDAEVERKAALKTLHLLDNPPVNQVHQHAQISHDAQKTPVNVNNDAVTKRVKKEVKAVESEKQEAKAKQAEQFKALDQKEVAASIKDMEAQVKAASNRTVKVEDVVNTTTTTTTTTAAAAAGATAPNPPWIVQQ